MSGVDKASAPEGKQIVEMLSRISEAESKHDKARARKGNAASYCVHCTHPCGPQRSASPWRI